MKRLTIFAILLLLPKLALAQLDTNIWHATIKVIDEDGQPVVNATAQMYWNVNAPKGMPQFDKTEGLTDSNGVFVTSHMANGSTDLGFSASKDGYYSARTSYPLAYHDDNDPSKWSHSVTLLLKKFGKPIAMYARLVDENPPTLGQPIGYDLMVGDWVCDGHKGVSSDIIVQKSAYRKSGADYEYKVKVTFPKNGDGIQIYTVSDFEMGSGLRSPHQAPPDGYQPELNKERSAHPGQAPKDDSDPSRIYLFRVRTVKDHEGNIASAHYGKIYGDFMQFTYYLNPTPNDRNIEFDPKQNLLQGLQSFETVTAP